MIFCSARKVDKPVTQPRVKVIKFFLFVNELQKSGTESWIFILRGGRGCLEERVLCTASEKEAREPRNNMLQSFFCFVNGEVHRIDERSPKLI